LLDDIGNAALTVFAGIVGLATIAVVIGQKSQAPQAIQATGGALSSIISAAVNPAATAATNGNPAASTQG
jgi:PRD1 phage membrane DNA delivery